MKKTTLFIYISIPIIALAISGIFIWFQMHHATSATPQTPHVSLDQSITTLEQRLKREPENVAVGIALTDGYLQKVRETGDVSFYNKIDVVLAELEKKSAGESQIMAKRAEVANGRHDFRKGLEYITAAIQKDPEIAAYYGIKSDSELELGLYDEAEAALQKMIDHKPNFSSYTRVAYQRELYGDTQGALEALATAISAGSIHPENVAWAYVESGKLRFKDDKTGAAEDFNRALKLYPDYAPALEGLGRVAYDQGKKEDARAYYTRAFTALPIATYAIQLGDFYAMEGETKKAQQQYELADQAYQNTKGTNIDLEYSLFLSDHGDKEEALKRAEAAYHARPSILAADAYAWALFKNNRITEAEQHSIEAMRLGGYNLTLLLHAAAIAKAQGKTAEAAVHLSK